ncbi:MAG: hypothetical protein IPK67_19545 [Planctomycetes bacterium]|nr:hypothetical protein [Planctomycetota bacterium]
MLSAHGGNAVAAFSALGEEPRAVGQGRGCAGRRREAGLHRQRRLRHGHLRPRLRRLVGQGARGGHPHGGGGGAKMYNTESCTGQAADTALQLRGGRGYETAASLDARGEHPFPMERVLRDARINRIVEGTTDVMHLFLAREALDKHLTLAGGLFKKGGLGSKMGTIAKCAAFSPARYAKLLLGIFRSMVADARLAGPMRAIDAATRRLARALFHRMVLMGPKLEMRQLTLNRLVDIGVELGVRALGASRAQRELDAGDTSGLSRALYWLEARSLFVEDLFTALSRNVDKASRAVSAEMMEQAEALPEVDSSGLSAILHDRGRDLTSGRVGTRAVEETAAAK